MHSKLKQPWELVDIVFIIVTLFVGLTVLLPFLSEVAKSFSQPSEVQSGRVTLFPRQFTFGNYHYFYRKHLETLSRAFLNSLFLVVAGTFWSVLHTALMAFPLSRPRKEFPLNRPIMWLVIFSLVFVPPVIPYFLTVKTYGLMDSLWAIILCHTVIPFQLVLVMNFFRGLPQDLFDSAIIDGANDFDVFVHVALPLSKAILAVVALFVAVLMWNIFYHAMLFIRSNDLMPLQVFVRGILQGGGDILQGSEIKDPFAETESSKSAIVLLTTIPIMLLYPYLRRFFVRGSLQGALKT